MTLFTLLILKDFYDFFYFEIIFTSILFLTGFGFSSVWISQSLNKLDKQMIVDFFLRLLIPSILIYLFANNLITVLLILACSYFSSSFIIWMKYLSIRVKFNFRIFYHEYLPFMGSKILISLYTSVLPFVAFYILTTIDFNNFVISEKLYRGGFSIYGPISQSLFPIFIKLGAIDNNSFKSQIKKQLLIQLLAMILLVSLILLFSPQLLEYYSGGKFDSESLNTFKLMVISYPLMIIGNILGLQFLLAKGFIKEMNLSLTIGALVMIVLIIMRVFQLISINLGWFILISELFVATSIINFSLKKWK